MQELSEIAQFGLLRAFIIEPPTFLSPANGVVGVALSYDIILVEEVAFRVSRNVPWLSSRTIEYSTMVAAILANASRWEESGGAESSGEDQELFRWWSGLSGRRFGRYVSPVVIEVSIGPDFPREPRPRDSSESDLTFVGEHRIVLRRTKQPMLHVAEGGGRFLRVVGPNRWGPETAWGTLGGFVETVDRNLYAMTAAHVAVHKGGYGTPARLFGDELGLRPFLGLLASSARQLLPQRWQWEFGNYFDSSDPDFVPQFQCQATHYTTGLDVALAVWPMDETAKRQELALGRRGQVSQTLPLHFIGARSGKQQICVSSYSIWHSYRLGDGGPYACISDCLQIKLRHRPHVREDVSRGGDSGAWIVAEGLERPHWIGLLVGGDGDRSGIVPAGRILNHFRPQMGLLRLLA